MQMHFKSEYKTIIKAPKEKVWQALTNPDLVKQYFFGSELVTDWKVGHPIIFQGEWSGKAYQDKGIVQEYIPNQTLTYTYFSSWSDLPELPENYLLISYTVMDTTEGTELSISQTNYDEERAKHSEGNWAQVIDGLKTLIE